MQDDGKYNKITIPDDYQGVKLGRQKTDWIAGANSPLKGENLLEDAKWQEYSSRHEIQIYNPGYSNAYDTSLCTQYAITDAVEHLLNYHLEEQNIPYLTEDWFRDNGYVVNNKLEISERLAGANSDMTTKGTYLYKAAGAVRDLGIVPQSKLELADSFEENINPELIPDEIYGLGLESKDHLIVNWQWLMSDVSEALKRSPLVATVKYADGDGILAPAGTHNHAVLVVEETDTHYIIDDSYWRQYKKYDKRYVSNFMELSLTFKYINMNKDEFIQKHDTHIVRNINTGAYGVIYAGNFLKIPDDRAGIFATDRLTRNYSKQVMASVTQAEWEVLDDKDLTF